ncbi:MAG: PEP-CTERM sorting domain-containing protein [Planctomycetes bacterium]|nr:PEP-CTERM sorting domain-containing protein [Planctomycetota bacterium]
MIRFTTLICATLFATAHVSAAVVFPYTVDFSTEDDDATPLVNGQAIDTEFGNLFTITSTVDGGGAGHLGPAIFDSTDPGPNSSGGDSDLLVNLGNILIFQNNAFPTQTTPGIFNTPNDEANFNDRGSFIFNFITPAELLSIDLVDINGGVTVQLTLTDTSGNSRIYDVPSKWTNDVSIAPIGYDTLDLTTLLPQNGEGIGGDATATEDPLFDPTLVETLTIAIDGSGAIDNLVIGSIPEPTSGILLTLGMITGLLTRHTRRRHTP